MATYFWIGLGSALGGMGRYWCTEAMVKAYGATFPWGTIFVNVSGSLAIGVLATVLGPEGRLFASPDIRVFLMIGICGGYTTFSSFSLQTLNLLRDGHWLWAGANVLGSVLLCVAAVWIGHLGAAVLSR
ncbi:MAG TPA: fluoride efflux transporter CrcB [Gammaproteobacteria bacterium]